MATNRSKVPADKAWKLGRAATVPVTAAWVGAGGALLNLTDTGSTITFTVAGVTVTAVATVSTLVGAYAKGIEEKHRGLRGMNGWQASYLTACTCAAGSWVTWAAATTPFGPYTAAAFAAGTLAAWILYPWYRYSRRDVIAAQHAAEFAPGEPEATDRSLWEAIFDDAKAKGITQAQEIETPGGKVLRCLLPENGSLTYNAVQNKLNTISVIAGHRIGLRSGALRMEHGRNDAEFMLHIVERDVLAELIPLPHDLELIESNQPFDIGLHEDATVMEWDFLRHGGVIGLTDSGKSNTLNVIIKKGGQCVDTLLWVIDPKGGRMIRPWIQPLLDGKVKRSVLDWVATNGGPTTMGTVDAKGNMVRLNKSPDEYHHLLDTACAEIDRRSNLGIGGEKVATSPDLPRIIVIIDEAADVLGDAKLLEKGKYIVRKGRSEGVFLLIAGQRGTASMLGDGDFRSQIHNWAGLGVRSQTDANMVFPDSPDISKLLPKIVHQGTLLTKRGARGRVLPGKSYRIEYDEIEALVIALSGRRPGLGQAASKYHGDIYLQRWSSTRIRHLFTEQAPAHEQQQEIPQALRPATQPKTEPTGRGPYNSTAEKYGLPPSRILGRLGIGSHKKDDDRELSAEGESLASEFEQFLATQAPKPTEHRPLPPTPAAEPGIDPRRVLVRRVIREAYPNAIDTRDIWPALNTEFGSRWDRTVVTNWLTQDVQAGLIHRVAKGQYKEGPAPAQNNEADTTPAPTDDVTRQANELMAEATDIVIRKQYCSAPFLQRQFRIGMDIANGLVLLLVASGTIGPDADANGRHEVLRQPDGSGE